MATPLQIARAILEVLPHRDCTGRVASADFGAVQVHVRDRAGEKIGHLTVRSDNTITQSLDRQGPELLELARTAAASLS